MRNVIWILMFALSTGCTFSFNNISSKAGGNASDMLDEEMSPTNDLKADLTIPVKAI